MKKCLSTLLSMRDKMEQLPICHPERPKKIEDFRRESKDLRTESTANVNEMRGFFDSADASLRMTSLEPVRFDDLLIQNDGFQFSIFNSQFSIDFRR